MGGELRWGEKPQILHRLPRLLTRGHRRHLLRLLLLLAGRLPALAGEQRVLWSPARARHLRRLGFIRPLRVGGARLLGCTADGLPALPG